jgi:hypothetical protein
MDQAWNELDDKATHVKISMAQFKEISPLCVPGKILTTETIIASAQAPIK